MCINYVQAMSQSTPVFGVIQLDTTPSWLLFWILFVSSLIRFWTESLASLGYLLCVWNSLQMILAPMGPTAWLKIRGTQKLGPARWHPPPPLRWCLSHLAGVWTQGHPTILMPKTLTQHCVRISLAGMCGLGHANLWSGLHRPVKRRSESTSALALELFSLL